MRILIVDDNAALLQTLRDIVEEAGHTVCTCTNGRDALVQVRIFKPNVILLDLALPEIDGLDVCRTLRADEGLAHIKIIAMSGLGNSEMRRKTANAGFDLHLRKPVGLDAVLDMLETLRVGVRAADKIHP